MPDKQDKRLLLTDEEMLQPIWEMGITLEKEGRQPEQIDRFRAIAKAQLAKAHQYYEPKIEEAKQTNAIKWAEDILEAKKQERNRMHYLLTDFVQEMIKAPVMHGDKQLDLILFQDFVKRWQVLKEDSDAISK